MSNETLHMIFDTTEETFNVATSNEKLLLREERTTKVREDTERAMLILGITERMARDPFNGPSFYEFTLDPLIEQLFWGVYDSKSESEKTKPAPEGIKELIEAAREDKEEFQEAIKCCMSVISRALTALKLISTGEYEPELTFEQHKTYAELALVSALMEIYCMGLRYGPALNDLKSLNSIPMEGGV